MYVFTEQLAIEPFNIPLKAVALKLLKTRFEEIQIIPFDFTNNKNSESHQCSGMKWSGLYFSQAASPQVISCFVLLYPPSPPLLLLLFFFLLQEENCPG